MRGDAVSCCVVCVACGCYATEVKRALHHANVGVVMLSSWSCFYFLPTQFASRLQRTIECTIVCAICSVCMRCTHWRGRGSFAHELQIEAWARKFRGACAQELQITCVRAVSFPPVRTGASDHLRASYILFLLDLKCPPCAEKLGWPSSSNGR